MNTDNRGSKNETPLSLMIIPENKAIAMKGAKPDQSRLGPKKNLLAVAITTNISVKRSNLPLNFIIGN